MANRRAAVDTTFMVVVVISSFGIVIVCMHGREVMRR
jgi:preprotein translocase subunit SecE